jgi:hypothetical protein
MRLQAALEAVADIPNLVAQEPQVRAMLVAMRGQLLVRHMALVAAVVRALLARQVQVLEEAQVVLACLHPSAERQPIMLAAVVAVRIVRPALAVMVVVAQGKLVRPMERPVQPILAVVVAEPEITQTRQAVLVVLAAPVS